MFIIGDYKSQYYFTLFLFFDNFIACTLCLTGTLIFLPRRPNLTLKTYMWSIFILFLNNVLFIKLESISDNKDNNKENNKVNKAKNIILQLNKNKLNTINNFTIQKLKINPSNRMSIYSGFATRLQQQSYDQLVEDLIFVFQKRILKFYNNQIADQNKFLDVLIGIHQQLSKMEQNKYLEPKTSKSFEELLKFLLKNSSNQQKIEPGKSAHLGAPYEYKILAKQTKSIAYTTPVLKINQDLKSSSRKDSGTKFHQAASIGKIIKQINSNNNFNDGHNQSNNSLGDSRNTFINQNKFNLTNINGNSGATMNRKQNPSLKNPEQDDKSDDKANKTEIQYKNRFKNEQKQIKGISQTNRQIGRDRTKQKQTRDYLLEYLQKNNKNYLRGYRKRQVKTRGHSKQQTANY